MPMSSGSYIIMNSHSVDDSHVPILGAAMFVLVIFCIYGIVCCCYHYQKIRLLRRSSVSNSATAEPEAAAATATTRSTPFHQSFEKHESESLPVLMPGDEFPKFVAWPCEATAAAAKTTKVDRPV